MVCFLLKDVTFLWMIVYVYANKWDGNVHSICCSSEQGLRETKNSQDAMPVLFYCRLPFASARLTSSVIGCLRNISTESLVSFFLSPETVFFLWTSAHFPCRGGSLLMGRTNSHPLFPSHKWVETSLSLFLSLSFMGKRRTVAALLSGKANDSLLRKDKSFSRSLNMAFFRRQYKQGNMQDVRTFFLRKDFPWI